MAKIGRNDPCLCGSGLKYKRCCLPRETAAAAPVEIVGEDDELDEASNRPIELIDAGRLDEAEQAARDLLRRFPEVYDGLERLAMVYAARGDRVRAAEYYRKAADFVLRHGDPDDLAMHNYLAKRATALDPPIP